MKGIHRAMVLSPLLFLFGCAAIGNSAQESTSQIDDWESDSGASGQGSDGRGSGSPSLQPRLMWNDGDPSTPPSVRVAPGVFAVLIPTAQLSFHAGDSMDCDWGADGPSTRLTLQGSDGNFVFYNHTNGKTWGAHTRAVDNPKGPGVTAVFQGDANLVVRNAAGNAIWASNTHTFPQAVLAFQSDGDLVIYNQVEGDAIPAYQLLWDTGTE